MTTTELRTGADERVLGNRVAECALRDDNQQFSEKQIEAARAATRKIAATIGDIVTVLSRDPKYHDMALKDLHALVFPHVAVGRCVVVYSESNRLAVQQPIAVVLWEQKAEGASNSSPNASIGSGSTVILSAGLLAACEQVCRKLNLALEPSSVIAGRG